MLSDIVVEKKYIKDILHYIVFTFWPHADAYECAKMLCDQYYLSSPDLVLREHDSE